MNNNKNLPVLILFLVGSCLYFPLNAETILSDNFEDQNYNGWEVNGNVATSGTVAIDSYALRLKRTATATTHIDTSTYQNVTVIMNLAASGLESGDECYAEISVDSGSSWQTLVKKIDGQDNKQFTQGAYNEAGASGNKDLQLRFRSTGNLLGDYCWGDNVTVTGNRASGPEIEISGSGVFGSVLLGQTSVHTVEINNLGNEPLSLQISNSNDSVFSWTHACPLSLIAGTSCQIDVSFTPSAVESYTAAITVNSNDSDESSLDIDLSGSGYETGGGSGTPDGFFEPLTGNGVTNRVELTAATLNGSSLDRLDYSAYALPENAAEPANRFEGRLVLNNGQKKVLNFEEQGTRLARSYVDEEELPIFDFEFIQSGSHIVPVNRGLIVASESVSWEWIIEPGRVWDEVGDNGYSRAAIPFALQESGANCTHNGVISFLFKDDGSITNAAVQVGGETCYYFKYDLWGMVDATYIPSSITSGTAIFAKYENEVARRMPIKSIEQLDIDFAQYDIDHSQFASEQGDDIVTFGVAIDGVHYTANCKTRYGNYPFCDVMDLPSYSTAKTVFASFALGLLSEQYGSNMRNSIVSEYVPECSGGQWTDVTFENLIDMATGNYNLSGYESDEGGTAAKNDFFLVYTHDEKINHSCNEYSRKAVPGSKMVYHSSDSYILGNALDAFVGEQDIYDKVVDEIYKPLGLSPVTYKAVRTSDSQADMYYSHGMTFHKDDLVKVAEFLTKSHGQINGQQVIDSEIVDDMLLQGDDLGLATFNDENRYLNGVWTWDMGSSSLYSCPSGTWVSYMSGYGGIGIVMLPNDMVYYFVSDSGTYTFNAAAVELQKIRSFCP
ncbi:choice-of-anchor D domain-containing protein [Aliikangiella sp. G2MR2-5]|uniref:choice-of-anchor D domain-containing protein n=1 Tax=Aliikangiella sp. G2MR2-5 TaxID=2788943 RepID=UPI0018A988F1|nr:choice-of-anchor D domain-containing protein [Aliikangiella sp. G2MR2-5]